MTELHSGIVTFLLTDIEGSTRLWEEHGSVMGDVLTRHDEIVQVSVEANGGVFVRPRGEGDSTFSVFDEPGGAVAAAVRIQVALSSSVWPTGKALRVRAAVHTGEAELHEGEYYGPTVNRCARLRGIAHGGQTIISKAAHERVSTTVFDGVTFRDLGTHRLKDLVDPERVWQVCHGELRTDFPALLSLDVLTNNLPAPLTSFVGRREELVSVCAALEGSRMLTLTGPGGIGKTRLSLEASRMSLGAFPDGVWLCELGALGDPDLVPSAIAGTFGLHNEAGQDETETLVAYLRSRALVLVLDGCEHLIDACAKACHQLLRECPNLRILATSRETLRIEGERAFEVGPLGGREDLSDAVQLFVDRAAAIGPATNLEGNRSSLGRICRRLDSIPLAIELAAARTSTLSVDEIAARLDETLDLLSQGMRSALPHHQTLRACIGWSHDLLTEPEQALFRRLAVFADGAALEVVDAVCDDADFGPFDVPDLIRGLMEKSLLLAVNDAGTPRIRMLETIRTYADEKLRATHEDRHIRRRHLECFLELATEASSRLAGSEQRFWLERLDADLENLRSALAYGLESDPELGPKLVDNLASFLHIRGLYGEARRVHEIALRVRRDRGDQAGVARLLNGLGTLARSQGDYPTAQTLYEESLAIERSEGNVAGASASLAHLGIVASGRGDYDGARVLFEESLVIRRTLGDSGSVASSLGHLGTVWQRQGDYASARRLYEEALTIHRANGDTAGVGTMLNNLGIVVRIQGDYTQARTLCEEALAIYRENGDRARIAAALNNLGTVSLHQGDYAAARSTYEESLTIRREIGDKAGIASSLHNLGNIAHEQSDHAAARRHYEGALAIHRETGNKAGVAALLNNLGVIEHSGGEIATARDHLDEAIAIRREIGDKSGTAETLNNLGTLARSQADYGLARECYENSVLIRRGIGDTEGLVRTVEGLGQLAAARRDGRSAARLLGAAASLRDGLGTPLSPDETFDHDLAVGFTREALEPREFENAWTQGLALSLDQVLDEVLTARAGPA